MTPLPWRLSELQHERQDGDLWCTNIIVIEAVLKVWGDGGGRRPPTYFKRDRRPPTYLWISGWMYGSVPPLLLERPPTCFVGEIKVK